MRAIRPKGALALALGLLLTASHPLAAFGAPEETPAPVLTAGERQELERLLDIQLGALGEHISPQERAEALVLLERAWAARTARLESGGGPQSDGEARLFRELNRLYDALTEQYLGPCGGMGGPVPPERTIRTYRILDGETLRPETGGGGKYLPGRDAEGDGAAHAALWAEMRGMLPPGAFDDFERLVIFTDGPDEVLAYVQPADWTGEKWEIAVDPADTADRDWFRETILHEYGHYLTLNEGQVTYTDHTGGGEVYREEGMTARSGSYLDDFYQTFWNGLLEDRLANVDSGGFYLRHPEDFVTEYAATDPAEDIAESLAWFVLYDLPPEEEQAVWAQKQRFFFRYPELAAFRSAVRSRLEG